MPKKPFFIIVTILSLSTGAVALADVGYVTGHHEISEAAKVLHMKKGHNGSVGQIGSDGDGAVTKAEIDAHDDLMTRSKEKVAPVFGKER